MPTQAPRKGNISIHSPRMGRDMASAVSSSMRSINFNPLSPHGERQDWARCYRLALDFNPLSPHGERPATGNMVNGIAAQFQSTLPAWGETIETMPRTFPPEFQSTLPAWGETTGAWQRWPPAPFQSTLPAWGETFAPRRGYDRGRISIHSPRMGRDMRCRWPCAAAIYFNPLSPHGERQRHRGFRPGMEQFQSTLPAWGETAVLRCVLTSRSISIHSPRMGRDRHPVCGRRWSWRFQSTLPAWGETR